MNVRPNVVIPYNAVFKGHTAALRKPQRSIIPRSRHRNHNVRAVHRTFQCKLQAKLLSNPINAVTEYHRIRT